MSNTIGIIKTQLTQLELDAQRIEANVAKALDYMGKPSDKKDGYTPKEHKIMAMLYRLDEIQEAIDGLMVELKEAGGITNYSYAGNVYEYKRPKVVVQPKEKRPEWVERKVYSTKTTAQQKRDKEQAAKKAAREAKAAAKAAKPAKPAPRPKAAPKSKELLKAERGVLDAKLDRRKVEAVFERQRIKDENWAAEAREALIKYADTPTKENGHQKRSQARIKLAAATGRLNTIEERKEARYRELSERQAKYEAEVATIANRSQK